MIQRTFLLPERTGPPMKCAYPEVMSETTTLLKRLERDLRAARHHGRWLV